MLRTLFTLLLISFSCVCFSQQIIIVKVKAEVDYTIDYAHNSVRTSHPLLAKAINEAGVIQITSLIHPGNKKASQFRQLHLVKHIHILQLSDTANIERVINDLQQSGVFEYV